jgi:protein subunit release factor B
MHHEAVSRVVVKPLSGPDSEAFAASLRRMYSAWSGRLAGEEGVHRVVQKSGDGRRHMSQARVEVDGQTSDETVRSYVTFPYHLVRDHRTGRETSEVARVIFGDLSLVRDD